MSRNVDDLDDPSWLHEKKVNVELSEQTDTTQLLNQDQTKTIHKTEITEPLNLEPELNQEWNPEPQSEQKFDQEQEIQPSPVDNLNIIPDNDFSKGLLSELPSAKALPPENSYEVFIHILDPAKKNDILEVLANLPPNTTGFNREELFQKFQNQTKIKFSFISLYEAILINIKLSKLPVKLQILEKDA